MAWPTALTIPVNIGETPSAAFRESIEALDDHALVPDRTPRFFTRAVFLFPPCSFLTFHMSIFAQIDEAQRITRSPRLRQRRISLLPGSNRENRSAALTGTGRPAGGGPARIPNPRPSRRRDMSPSTFTAAFLPGMQEDAAAKVDAAIRAAIDEKCGRWVAKVVADGVSARTR